MDAGRESVPLSALQHYAFCPRQCGLIHLEQTWTENVLTAEGRILHDRAHDPGGESRGDLRIARAVPLESVSLGLHGVADIVEFHRTNAGTWQPYPVEYKRGRPKHEPIDEVQLCAQALCLEEMLATTVPAGALFYGKTHRRQAIEFTDQLRAETHALAAAVHTMLASGRTPPAEYGPRCRSCSLFEVCRPQSMRSSASAYLERLMNAAD